VQVLCGSLPPACTGRHCPVVFAAWPFRAAVQAEQPAQALSQQTPSARTPELHSLASAAACPLGFWAAQVLVVLLQ